MNIEYIRKYLFLELFIGVIIIFFLFTYLFISLTLSNYPYHQLPVENCTFVECKWEKDNVYCTFQCDKSKCRIKVMKIIDTMKNKLSNTLLSKNTFPMMVNDEKCIEEHKYEMPILITISTLFSLSAVFSLIWFLYKMKMKCAYKKKMQNVQEYYKSINLV